MGLEAAQIQQLGLIGSSVLWNGQTVTLVGVNGADAYLDTGTTSTVAPLSELDLVGAASRLVSSNGHFTSPGVFRATSVSGPATCSVDEPAEHDASLDACFDPSSEAGRQELIRQAAEGNEEQRVQAADTIRSVLNGTDEKLKAELLADLQEAEGELGACEAEQFRRTYSQALTAPQPSSTASSAGSREGNSGGSISEPRSGGGAPLVATSGGGGAVPVVGTSGLDPSAEGLAVSGDSLLATTVNLPAGERPVSSAGFVPSDSDAGPSLPVVGTASAPVALNAFTLAIPAFLPAAALGALEAPRSPNVSAEAGFFQNLFDRLPVNDASSGLVDLLTHPSPEFAPKVYEVRRAVADVMRAYRATYGSAAPFETASIPLSFRYDPERRRIEVAIRPSGSVGASSGLGGEGEGRSSRFSDFTGSFRTLSLFRLGSDDHRSGPEFGFGPIVAFVPVPQQYLQGVRVGDGVVTVRADGRATDRGVERLARRDSANDQHGGSHSDDREGGGSRDGRGRNRRDDRETYPSEELDSAAA